MIIIEGEEIEKKKREERKEEMAAISQPRDNY